VIQLWPESQRDAGDEDAAAVEEVEEGDGDVVAAVDDDRAVVRADARVDARAGAPAEEVADPSGFPELAAEPAAAL